MKSILKKAAAKLPTEIQAELKRYYFWSLIRYGKFESTEPEYLILKKFLKPGDWSIDVGANVGHYSALISNLVGPNGRVIAFEPVPDTFALLSANTSRLPFKNVTLINSAVSDCTSCMGMEIPNFESGLKNYYRAHLTADGGALSVLSLSVDSLCISNPIRLIKIDAEGHEYQVLFGAQRTIKNSHPLIIVEGKCKRVESLMSSLGYRYRELRNSPNRIFEH
ncbi:FkbM family methyltransferase [bacterium]|nr:FkbM family methyltransferase [bacterium]